MWGIGLAFLAPLLDLELSLLLAMILRIPNNLIPLKSLKCKEGMCPLKRAKVELDFHHYFHHYHHSFATHAHVDLTYWLVLLDPWFDYAINVLYVCISCLPPMSSRYQNLIRVGWERRQCHYAPYQKYHILWEKAYTITVLVRIQKYHKRETRDSHTRKLWVLFENMQNLQSYN